MKAAKTMGMLSGLFLSATMLVAAEQVKKPKEPTDQKNKREFIGGLEPKQVLELFGYRGVEAATDQQVAGYRRVFGFLDADRDLRHSKKEFVEDGRYMTRQARQGIFRAADSNEDGFVSRAEYVENRIITDEAKEIFFKMDGNRDNRLTLDELQKSGKFKDRKLTKAIFQALDADRDDELVIPEYLRIWGRWARGKTAAAE